MQLAIFDLDNTLLSGDSDYLWGEYLCENGHIDSAGHREAHQQYYDDYREGRLDIDDFLRFQLQPLAANPFAELQRWRDEYIEQKIRPIILEKGLATIADHRRRGHELLIITATNSFITAPIAELLGIEHLIGTEPEFVDGRYTGRVSSIPSYQDGKVKRLEMWLAERGEQACEKWFYSDSHNDIPLLERVDHAIAVDPDEKLAEVATERGWPIISLR
ncbi:MAG: HAD family hydrolase [Gammaproteobacteria bacterium]